MPLLAFLKEQKRQQPVQNLVIGNEAGDADTIISSISLAFIESAILPMKCSGSPAVAAMPKTPVIAIPKDDLLLKRPEVMLMLKLAGITHPGEELVFVDDAVIQNEASDATVTLVDHNVLSDNLCALNWTVIEIVDHHRDEGFYLDTCPVGSDSRNIAFADEKALVASCCTLVAERLKEAWLSRSSNKRPLYELYPAPLSTLLLGVILLDSVNLSEEVGKVTQRDRDAVQDLLANTDWLALAEKSRDALRISGDNPSHQPDPSAFFQLLQSAKYDPDFWRSLTVQEALRMDYKDFVPGNEKYGVFGIPTILTSAQEFGRKANVVPGILDFMQGASVHFLAIMFAYELQENAGDVNDSIGRQLVLCVKQDNQDDQLGRLVSLDDITAFLLSSDYDADPLDLVEIEGSADGGRNGVFWSDNDKNNTKDKILWCRAFDQRNVKDSRKQIGPILLEYFDQF